MKDDAAQFASQMPPLVSTCKLFEKHISNMGHFDKYSMAVDLLRVAVSFQLQLAKLPLTDAAVTGAQNPILFQLCGFRGQYNSLVIKFEPWEKFYREAVESTEPMLRIDPLDLLSFAEVLVSPEALTAVINEKCEQYTVVLQGVPPQMAIACKDFHMPGSGSWKSGLLPDATLGNILERIRATLATIPGKNLKKILDETRKAS